MEFGEPSMLRGVNGGRVFKAFDNCCDSVDFSAFFGRTAQREVPPSLSSESSSFWPPPLTNVAEEVDDVVISVVDGGVGSCCAGTDCFGRGLAVPSTRFSSMKPCSHLRSSARTVWMLPSSSIVPRFANPSPGKPAATAGLSDGRLWAVTGVGGATGLRGGVRWV